VNIDTDYTQPIGGTKFLLAFCSACASTALVWFGKIDGNIFRDVILGCVGAYIAGNVVARMKRPIE
jgi:uncharacterized membrane protein YeaQ/YmgE (transglycosylase-associated protein family)